MATHTATLLSAPAPSLESNRRISAIDQLRGVLMIVMTLDHVRDFFAPTAFDPLDWQTGSAAWYWTRWITHLCAPGFILLAGLSAGLRSARVSRHSLARYLLQRGVLLIALELSWVSFSWQFGFSNLILQVIWAIGVAMCVLAFMLYLPRSLQIGFAAACLLGHNALYLLHGQVSGGWFKIMHEGGYLPIASNFGVVVVYPLIPWLGLIVAGYLLAPVWHRAAAQRLRFCWGAAGTLLVLFLLLRLSAIYGDPHHWPGWQADYSVLENLMEFVRVEKYPPSLHYLAITLGLNLACLALFEACALKQWHSQVLHVFGQHAQLYYLLHIASLHLAGNLFMLTQYGQVVNFFTGKTVPAAYQASLFNCYLAWLISLAVFYRLLNCWHQRQLNSRLSRTTK